MNTYKKILKSYFNSFDDTYLNYQFDYQKNQLSRCLNGQYIILQSTYFNKISDVFQNYIVQLFLDILNNTKDGNYSKFIPISQIFNHIDKNSIKNTFNFRNFIDILKNSVGELQIRVSNQSYYQVPNTWSIEKIRISNLENKDIFSNQLDKVGNQYKEYMLKLTNKCKTLSQSYSEIKKNILNLDSFGVISISSKYFIGDKKQYLKTVIWHQIQHFLNYLIRINAQNWNIGRQYSHKIHNDFITDQNGYLVNSQRTNYFLDEEEFKPLAGTYIEQLKILFRKNCENYLNQEEIKIFLSIFLKLCEIQNTYCNLNKISSKKLSKYIMSITELFSFKDIKDFFYINYLDSKQEKENQNSRNRWTILKKWLWRQFLKP